MKKCNKCEKEKPADLQHFVKRGPGKLRGFCRDCINAKNRKRYKEAMGGSTKREQRAVSRESDPKVCIKCKEPKPLIEFNIHDIDKGQHRNFCKDCQNAWARKHNKTSQAKKVRGEWNENNAEKIKEYHELYRNDPVKVAKQKVYHRRYWLKQYGVTPEEYDDMLKSQGGKCMICEATKPGGRKKNFTVDHCHDTGKVRGLLCGRCNSGIGFFRENDQLLTRAARYVFVNL